MAWYPLLLLLLRLLTTFLLILAVLCLGSLPIELLDSFQEITLAQLGVRRLNVPLKVAITLGVALLLTILTNNLLLLLFSYLKVRVLSPLDKGNIT